MILVALLAAPLAGAAVLLAAITRRTGSGDTARIVPLYGLVVTGVTLALALIAAAVFDYGEAGRMQLQVDREWIPGLDLRFHLGVDGISLPLVVLTALLTFLCFVYLLRHRPAHGRLPELAFTLLVLEVGMIGTFLALDLLLFFVFFEIVLIPMYFVIAVWGGTERRAAAVKFILYTLLGSAVLLLGLLLIWSHAGTLDMIRLAERHGEGIPRAAQILAFLAIGAGFAVKAPMWPLHTWLPAAHTEAPTVGSVLLAGVLLKMGTYGFARIALPVLPDGAAVLAPWLGAFAVAGIIYGSLACLAQRDLKRLIAYSSVGHMGFILLGLATLTPAGVNAALFGNIAHGLITGLLFFVVGSLKDRYHTTTLTTPPSHLPIPSPSDLPIHSRSDLPVTPSSGLPDTPPSDLPIPSRSDLPVTPPSDLPIPSPSGLPDTPPSSLPAASSSSLPVPSPSGLPAASSSGPLVPSPSSVPHTLPSGLLGTLPYLSSVLTFACVASLGLPGLAGFWGEMLSLLAAFTPASGLSQPLYLTYMAIGGIGTVLTAAYFLRTLTRITHGPPALTTAGGPPVPEEEGPTTYLPTFSRHPGDEQSEERPRALPGTTAPEAPPAVPGTTSEEPPTVPDVTTSGSEEPPAVPGTTSEKLLPIPGTTSEEPPAVPDVTTSGDPSDVPGTTASGDPSAVSDVTVYELAAWTPLVVLILALGLWPKALLAVTDPAVRAFLGAP